MHRAAATGSTTTAKPTSDGSFPTTVRRSIWHPMPTNLRAQLAALADTFADAVLAAIRSASIEDLQAESGPARRGARQPRGGTTTGNPKTTKGGRLARRSPEDIAKVLAQVVALVKKIKTGLRAEEIRKALNLDVREMPRVLREGVAKRVLTSKGQKRATTYSAARGVTTKAASAKTTAAKRPKKARKK